MTKSRAYKVAVWNIQTNKITVCKSRETAAKRIGSNLAGVRVLSYQETLRVVNGKWVVLKGGKDAVIPESIPTGIFPDSMLTYKKEVIAKNVFTNQELVFESKREAAEHFNVKSTTLSSSIRNERKGPLVDGFQFRLVEAGEPVWLTKEECCEHGQFNSKVLITMLHISGKTSIRNMEVGDIVKKYKYKADTIRNVLGRKEGNVGITGNWMISYSCMEVSDSDMLKAYRLKYPVIVAVPITKGVDRIKANRPIELLKKLGSKKTSIPYTMIVNDDKGNVYKVHEDHSIVGYLPTVPTSSMWSCQ